MTAKIVVAAALVQNERFRLPVGLTGAGSTIRIAGCDGSARPDGSFWPIGPIAALQFFGRYWEHSEHRDALETGRLGCG
jgi:hypothetical protein